MQSSHGEGTNQQSSRPPGERAACNGGGTFGSPSPGARTALCACASDREALLLQVRASEGFVLLFFTFFGHPLLSDFLNIKTINAVKALLQSSNVLRQSVILFGQEL